MISVFQSERAHDELPLDVTFELPIMVWKAGPDGKFNYFNKCWLEFTGRHLEQELSDGWMQLVHPDDRTICMQSFYNAFHARNSFRIEHRHKRHDGTFRWLRCTGKPLYSSEGKYLGYIGCGIDITEQKKLEENVANNRNQVKKFSENVPMPMYCIDMDGRIIFSNSSYQLLTGYSEKELSTKRVNDIHTDKLLMWEMFSKMLAGYSVKNHQTRIRCRDGKEKDVILTATNLWEDGKFIYACCYIQDKAHTASAHEDEVKRLNKMLGAVILAGKMISSTLETEKLVQFIANAAITLSGAEFGSFFYHMPGNAPGTTGFAAAGALYEKNMKLKPIDPEEWNDAQPFFINDVTRSRTWKNRKLDGIPAGMEVKSYAIVPLYRKDNVSGCIYLAHTQPNMFTGYMAHALKSLSTLASIMFDNAGLYESAKEEKDKFRTLTELIPQMIWTATPAGDIDYCNPQWESYTGFSPGETKANGWLEAVHAADREQAGKAWIKAISTGNVFEGEYRMKRASDSTYRWQLVRALPFNDKHGRISKWFGSCTDIDGQKKLDEQKDNFMSIASHELKTPLTTIKAYLQLLAQVSSDNTIMQYLAKASDCTNKLNGLVSDLLDVSRIQGGRMQYKTAPLKLPGFLLECVDNLQGTITTHKIEKDIDVNAVLQGDRQRLEQVISNLLQNAVKYSPGKSTIKIAAKREENHVKISVIDQGIGIAEHHQPKLFQRFYRVEAAADRFPGLGIGLYISYEIVKFHQGTIGVKSRENEGSEFFITLPVNEWL